MEDQNVSINFELFMFALAIRLKFHDSLNLFMWNRFKFCLDLPDSLLNSVLIYKNASKWIKIQHLIPELLQKYIL